MRCARCGQPFAETDKFCTKCGADIRAQLASLPATPSGKPQRRFRWWYIPAGIGGSALLLFMACLTLGLVLSSSPSYKATATAKSAMQATATSAAAVAEVEPTHQPTRAPDAVSPAVQPTVMPTIHRPVSPSLVPPRPTFTVRPTVPPTAVPTSSPVPTLSLVRAQCVAVVDGDTIDVVIDGQTYRIRYIGIDTPETVHPSKPVEWMGKEASAANKALVEGQVVYLEKDVSETDRYDRLLRYVYVAGSNGELVFVNEFLVRQGFAHVSTYPPDVRYEEVFLEAERQAREEGVGLWGPTPLPTQAPPPPTPVPTGLPTVPPTAPPPPPPSAEPPPAQPTAPAQPGQVQIVFIFYDGNVPRVESDEYAEIKNTGGSPVNLSGWHLNADDPGQDFWFPDFVLQPGQACRVYTNENHPESCGFSFGSSKALWANDGECGHLFNAGSVEVSTFCY